MPGLVDRDYGVIPRVQVLIWLCITSSCVSQIKDWTIIKKLAAVYTSSELRSVQEPDVPYEPSASSRRSPSSGEMRPSAIIRKMASRSWSRLAAFPPTSSLGRGCSPPSLCIDASPSTDDDASAARLVA